MYIQELLNKIDIFKELDAELATELQEKLVIRKMRKKMIVFMEGEPADYIYFILKGKIKLSKISTDGQEKIVHIIPGGQFLGEVAVLDGGVNPLTAETLEETEVGLLEAQEFRSYVMKHPQLAYLTMEIMAKRLRQSYRQIKNLALKNAQSRLASRLFKLSREYGVPMNNGIFIKAAFTHQDLASMIGSSRETVSRMLKDFEKAGILKIVRQKITIVNMDKLRELF